MASIISPILRLALLKGLCLVCCLQVISKAWPDSKQSLERLRGDLNSTLEKLQTREKYLNEMFEGLMTRYRASRTTLTDVQVRRGCVCVAEG